jgi:hypothetical protein
MPLARYFSFVGGVLLALLFVLDAFVPKVPVAEKATANLLHIRITSDRKWPERIVYDTNAPASIASAEVTVDAPETIADASADATAREAFAMLMASVDQSQPSNARMRELKVRHPRNAVRKRAPAPKVAMARHLQFGWFGRSFW